MMPNYPNNIDAKNAKIYVCETCHFKCSKLSNYNKHLSTRKHQLLINNNELGINADNKLYSCTCGNEYKHASSLSYHKKKCSFVQKDTEEEPKEEPKEDTSVHTGGINNPESVEKMFAMFTQMMTQNQEFMTTVIGKIGNNTNTNCNNTNNNNQFNINMFLNEICQRLIETGSAHEDTIATT